MDRKNLILRNIRSEIMEVFMNIVHIRRYGFKLLLFLCSLLFISGCAVTGGVESKTVRADGNPGQGQTRVESIGVVGDGNAVLIETTGPVKYTVFKLMDPPRLIVDLPGVSLEKITSPMVINNRYLRTINASSYGGDGRQIGRLVMTLQEGTAHEVKSGENSILVTLRRDSPPSTAMLQEEDEPEGLEAGLEGHPSAVASLMDTENDKGVFSAGDEDTGVYPKEASAGVDHLMGNEKETEVVSGIEESVDEGTPVVGGVEEGKPEVEEVPEPSVPSTADKIRAEEDTAGEETIAHTKEATELLRIDSSIEDDTTVIRIMADGTIGSYNSFELDSPPRLVVDIWNVDSSIGQYLVSVGGPHIDRIRIGRHTDKVRLVFDSATTDVPDHVIKKVDDSIVLSFGVRGGIPGSIASVGPIAAYGPEPSPEEETQAPEVQGEVQKAEEAVAETVDISEEKAGEDMEVGEPVVEEAPEAPPIGAYGPGMEMEERPQPSPPEQGMEIRRVDFKKFKDTARLIIEGSQKPEYTVKESLDGKILILNFSQAIIPDELKRTLDATRLNTPVVSISSYQATLEPTKDVRILVRLKDKTPYEVIERDNTVAVDFPLPPPSPEVMKAPEEKEEKVAYAEEKEEEPILPEKKYTGKRINLDMVDAEITDILRLLAEVSDLNIIASDDVKGTITLRLKDVPWDQAFDIILKTKGLDKVQEGNVIRVAPQEKIMAERQALMEAKKAEEKLEDLQIEFISINYAKAEDLEGHVKEVLSDRGTVTSELRTNTLIVKDIKAGIEAAKDLVARLDAPTPQVLIEARIVEAESSFARDLGVQWGLAGGTTSKDNFGTLFGSTSTEPPNTLLPSGYIGDTGVFSDQPNFVVDLPAAGTAGPLGAMGFSLGKITGDPLLLDLRISAGEQAGLVKTISRPRITTLDNKEARIEQGESIPFESTSAAGTQTIFVDAFLSLSVTPHITPDGSVLMKIKASKNSIGTFRTSTGEPSIAKKEASTEVLVRDGETTVIGGIIISDTGEIEKGIPFFKDIPLLGWLFKNKSVSDTQKELLIFITPIVMKEEAKVIR